MIRMGWGALLPGWLGAQEPGPAPGRGSRTGPRVQVPEITQPILFHAPEADRILERLQVFPADNPWNTEVSDWPLHPNSRNIIATIGAEKPMRYNPDINFVLVPPGQRLVRVEVGYRAESDRGPFPIPENLPIEGWPGHPEFHRQSKAPTIAEMQRDNNRFGGDRHAVVVDPVNGMLYEFYQALRTDAGWKVRFAAVFDLRSNELRPDTWTSADAAGLPLFPAVVKYHELQRGEIRHAMRVTVTRTRQAFVHPATHFASRSNDPNLPRMGERIRLRRDYDTSGFSPVVRTILEGLKHYGMFVADNGIDWAISVTPDPRIPILNDELRRIRGSAFEVVEAPRARRSGRAR
jgi:hypothetical protein